MPSDHREAAPTPAAAHWPHAGLDDQAALVTGGRCGIGLASARRLVASGARVLVCGRSEPGPLSAGLQFVAADVRDPGQAAAVVAEANSRFGRLDIVVNNAGGSPSGPASLASPHPITSFVKLKLLAPFFLAPAANAFMTEQGDRR